MIGALWHYLSLRGRFSCQMDMTMMKSYIVTNAL
jgi:hypothetical protein